MSVTPIRRRPADVFGSCEECGCPLTPEWKSATPGVCDSCEALREIEVNTERTKRLVERMERRDGDRNP